MDATGIEIAVIGVSGKFPGSKNINEYWQNLRNGRELIRRFSDEELMESGISGRLLTNPNYIKAHGFLDNNEMFDYNFFGYSPNDAELMDPQIRLAHECAWNVLEDAGYNPDSYKGTIGLIVGASSNIEWQLRALSMGEGFYETHQLCDVNFLATRVSYKLDLKGPSCMVQTTCSSSLVAVHMACQSIILGESDICLAGGVSIGQPKKEGYLYQEGMVGSPDGHCRPFDEQAQGTVGGDGIGIVVLKSLEDALTDGDNIYAVIKGSGTNNDGNRKVGYTAPSTRGQAELINSVHYLSDIDSESISYIETHGTGTIMGDPVEIAALKLAFDTDKKGFCRIGSVKSNIGHLDSASGIAGFIKTLLAIKNKEIPPLINFQKPNPKIDFDNSPFIVNDKPFKWENRNGPLRAGVSSFGIGGTNAHLILEEPPARHDSRIPDKYNLVPLSAKSEKALNELTNQLTRHLRNNPESNISDIAYTLQHGRKEFKYRKAVVCSSVEELIINLIDNKHNNNVAGGLDDKASGAVFMFPGEDAQYLNMGWELYNNESFLKSEIDQCFDILKKRKNIDLKNMLFPQVQSETIRNESTQTASAQPILFIFEYALAKLLMHWGINPHAVTGYGAGKYAAGCLAGVFTLSEGLDLVFERGRIMQESALGAMTGQDLTTLKDTVKKINLKKPDIPYISNLTGDRIEEAQAIDPDYWMKHSQNTIRFPEGLSTLPADRGSLLIEVGPVNSLNTPVSLYEQNRNEQAVVNLVKHPQQDISDICFLYKAVGSLWQQGLHINWDKFCHDHKKYMRVSLPGYPFEAYPLRKVLTTEVDFSKLSQDREKNKGIILNGVVPGIKTERPDRPAVIFTGHARPDLSTPFVKPESDDEVKISWIWRELLGLENVGTHDNFFELGGHSLLTTSLIKRIEDAFNTNLSIKDFYSDPTIVAMSKLLSGGNETKTLNSEKVRVHGPAIMPDIIKKHETMNHLIDEIVVNLNITGGNLPLFGVSGAPGTIQPFIKLADNLGADQPFYGLQALGLNGKHRPLKSIEEIANLNVQAILSIQKQGPYYLLGYSFGGWVVYEMASQLEKSGHRVAMLAIIDCIAPHAGIYSDSDESKKDSSWMFIMMSLLEKFYNIGHGLNYDELNLLEEEEMFNYVQTHLSKININLSVEQIRGHLQVFKTNVLIKYNIQTAVNASITLFKALQINHMEKITERAEALYRQPAMGWDRYTKNGVSVHMVPGDHISMLSNANIKIFASDFKKIINEKTTNMAFIKN